MGKYFYILQQQYLRIDRRCIYVISHRYFYVCISTQCLVDVSIEGNIARLFRSEAGLESIHHCGTADFL